MKITIEHYDNKYTIETPDGVDAEGMYHIFRKIMLVMEFGPSVIDEYLPEEV